VQRQIADTRFISSACTEGGWAESIDPSYLYFEQRKGIAHDTEPYLET
jgi:hypothetical protein